LADSFLSRQSAHVPLPVCNNTSQLTIRFTGDEIQAGGTIIPVRSIDGQLFCISF